MSRIARTTKPKPPQRGLTRTDGARRRTVLTRLEAEQSRWRDALAAAEAERAAHLVAALSDDPEAAARLDRAHRASAGATAMLEDIEIALEAARRDLAAALDLERQTERTANSGRILALKQQRIAAAGAAEAAMRSLMAVLETYQAAGSELIACGEIAPLQAAQHVDLGRVLGRLLPRRLQASLAALPLPLEPPPSFAAYEAALWGLSTASTERAA